MSQRKWPYEATEELRFTIRLTPKQLERWREARVQSAERSMEKWIVQAVSFFAWYWSRERELAVEMQAKLDAEARAKREAESW